MDAPDFAALQTALAGQYSLDRELGRGGMGVVYLAREVRLDRLVALKVLPPALAARDELRARFLREARTAAGLAHPNVVPVHRVDEAGPFVYLVMAYVDGGTLGDRLRARGALLPDDAARVGREVALALAYAHARGVVHRDVKPDNVLLDRATGRALVADFGIAKLGDGAGGTGEGLVMGTAAYMSPEQAAGEPLDGRSDLYALGAVLYQALAGRPPFEANGAAALLARHLTQAPPPLPAAAPPRLARVVMTCLAKRPEERPATGERLAELLGDALPAERALPAPLRLWADARDPLALQYALWSGAMLVGAAVNASLYFTADSAAVRAQQRVLFPLLLAAAPLVPIAVRAVVRLLPAVRAGYGIDDLRRALREHTERSRGDASAAASPVPAWLARALRIVAYGGIGLLAATIVWFVLSRPGITPQSSPDEIAYHRARQRVLDTLLLVVLISNVLGSALGVTWPGGLGRGWADALRQRFWDGRAGAAVVDHLRRLTRRGAAAAPEPADRPTEHVLGLAAGELYAGLPAPARRALGDVPALLDRLARDAEAARARSALLAERLAAVDVGREVGAAAEREALRDDLTRERDRMLERREHLVTALETLRLDLLRLHAGDATPAALTAAVERARALGAAVDARLAAPAAPAAAPLAAPAAGHQPARGPSPPDSVPASG